MACTSKLNVYMYIMNMGMWLLKIAIQDQVPITYTEELNVYMYIMNIGMWLPKIAIHDQVPITYTEGDYHTCTP